MSNRRVFAGALLLLLLVPSFAFAADVPAGTRIPASVDNDVKNGIVSVNYTVTDDVRDSTGAVLIPKGSKGVGRVLQYRRPKMWGGPGKTEVSFDSVTTPDGKQLSVNAKATTYGRDTRILTILVAPYYLTGFFVKGGSGKIGHHNNLTFTAR